MNIKNLFNSMPAIMIAGLLFLNSCSKDTDQQADTSDGEKASESENVIQDAIGQPMTDLTGQLMEFQVVEHSPVARLP